MLTSHVSNQFVASSKFNVHISPSQYSVDPKHDSDKLDRPAKDSVEEVAEQQADASIDSTAADESKQPGEVEPASRSLGKLLQKILLIVACISLLMCGMLWMVYRSTQNEPTFYGQVAEQPKVQLEENGDKFETAILELQNNAHLDGPWRAVFKDQEVNGWLEVDCPKKFPELIPNFASNPRVQILDSQISLAFRYNSRRFKSIVLVVTDVFVVEDTDEIAVRIKKAQTGIVPLPIAAVADRITAHLRKSGMSVTWTEMEGDPVALIRVPDDLLTFDGQTIRIEAITCMDHQIELIGRSSAKPQ
jgi:hypothetical protein